jgi:hypothetical protein
MPYLNTYGNTYNLIKASSPFSLPAAEISSGKSSTRSHPDTGQAATLCFGTTLLFREADATKV